MEKELADLGNVHDPRDSCIFFAELLISNEVQMTLKHALLMRSYFNRLKMLLKILKRNDQHYPMRYAVANTEITIRKIEALYFT